jgi:hypothetical protein
MAGTLDGTVKIPLVGTVKKKYAVIGIGITLALIGITLYRRKQAGTSATGATVTDPAGNVCAAVNPATGYCPGTPEDTAFLAQNTPSAPIGSNGADSGSGSGGDGGGGSQSGPPFANNQAWSQWATTYLVGTIGENAHNVAQALGDYLAGRPVDTPEENIINQAIGYAGNVPVTATDGFPPSIRHKGTKGGGQEKAVNPVTGLHASGIQKTVADITWHPAAHAGSYGITLFHKTQKMRTYDVTAAKTRLTGLKSGESYTVHVLARPPKPSAHDAHVTFKTK